MARINGPDRIAENGIIELNVSEGIISDIKLRFPGADGESIIDGKPRKGKTKDWVIKRELKTQPGTIFNRKILEADISRLYATSLFDDVKVSLGPDSSNPRKVIIFLDLSEQRTGSLTGGIGYSNSSGIFATVGLQETNALGRAWSTNLNLILENIQQHIIFLYLTHGLREINIKLLLEQIFFLVEIIHENLRVKIMELYTL